MNFQSIIIVFFSAAIVASYYFGYTPPIVCVMFFLFSLVAYFFYAKDKKAAINGRWRVPENTLHLLALCCGWPGALIAQEKLRHKTRKLSFRAVFWCTVLVNAAAIAWLHTPRGNLQLRNTIFQIENLAMTYVHSEAFISAVFFLTQYRSQ